MSDEFKRVRFLRRFEDGHIVASDYGSWRAQEIADIMALHERFGNDVIVQDEWPEVIEEWPEEVWG